jgi:hypothetical protein
MLLPDDYAGDTVSIGPSLSASHGIGDRSFNDILFGYFLYSHTSKSALYRKYIHTS